MRSSYFKSLIVEILYNYFFNILNKAYFELKSISRVTDFSFENRSFPTPDLNTR